MRTALRDFRKEKGLTLYQMASIWGISNSFYVKIEYGIKAPSYDSLRKFKISFPDADINKIFF